PAPASGVLLPGTQRYRSPEARAFHRDGGGCPYVPSPADDVYALGAVFYWVLTGRHPFEGADTPEEVDAVLHQAPVAPDALNPRVPPVLGALCLRLLSKRPEARGGARELCEALETALEGADAGWETALGEATPAVPGELALDGPPRRGSHFQTPETGPVALEVRARPMPPSFPHSVALLRAVALAGLVAGLAMMAYAARPWLQAPGHPEVARDVSTLPRSRP
ncbi:MAG TPA: serine/threonine protein kinase, partial [Myxococcus sp.]|nr:serine/threonine protein kinase [Myxococcus sp.]